MNVGAGVGLCVGADVGVNIGADVGVNVGADVGENKDGKKLACSNLKVVINVRSFTQLKTMLSAKLSFSV